MTSHYDAIGERYAAVKRLPLARATEIPAVERLLSDPSGLHVLDLACGHGFYARRAASLGAASVLGVDLSAEMVAAARREEERHRLGIRYLQADAATATPAALGRPEGFDRVLALFLFNYADTPEALEAQARAVAGCLSPGGRLIAVLPDPAFRCGDPGSARYGFRSTALLERPEGRQFAVEILVEPPIRLVTWQWRRGTVEASLAAAGLRQVQWHPLGVSDAGVAEQGAAFWEAYRVNPPNIALTATR